MPAQAPMLHDSHASGASGSTLAAHGRSAARRRLGKALLAAALALGAGAAVAQPFFAGRMSPDERERFRRELRQQQPERGRYEADQRFRRERMSPSEREQLRRQLREARPDDRRGRGRRP